jgi:hypothetical protein
MSQYVRLGKSGRLGRLARTHRVSGLRGMRGTPAAQGSGITAAQRSLINTGFRGLRLGYYTSEDYAPDQYGSVTQPSAVPSFSPSGSPGGLTPADASVLSAAITAAGKVGTQAIIGTPTLTYNPLTGQYTATGGATIPTSAALSSEISSYLPLILLAGGAVLIFSMVGRR